MGPRQSQPGLQPSNPLVGPEAYSQEEKFFGRGGFGVVFRGVRLADGRKVALKKSLRTLDTLTDKEKDLLFGEIRL